MNSVLINNISVDDLEKIISRVIDQRIESFFERTQKKQPLLVKRKDAALRLGVSLPTLDAYAKMGILHAKHIGGRVFYSEDELMSLKSNKAGDPFTKISPFPSKSHSHETP